MLAAHVLVGHVPLRRVHVPTEQPKKPKEPKTPEKPKKPKTPKKPKKPRKPRKKTPKKKTPVPLVGKRIRKQVDPGAFVKPK